MSVPVVSLISAARVMGRPWCGQYVSAYSRRMSRELTRFLRAASN